MGDDVAELRAEAEAARKTAEFWELEWKTTRRRLTEVEVELATLRAAPRVHFDGVPPGGEVLAEAVAKAVDGECEKIIAAVLGDAALRASPSPSADGGGLDERTLLSGVMTDAARDLAALLRLPPKGHTANSVARRACEEIARLRAQVQAQRTTKGDDDNGGSDAIRDVSGAGGARGILDGEGQAAAGAGLAGAAGGGAGSVDRGGATPKQAREHGDEQVSPSPSAGAVPEVRFRVEPGVESETGWWCVMFGRALVTSWTLRHLADEHCAKLNAEVPKPHADAGGEVERLTRERDRAIHEKHFLADQIDRLADVIMNEVAGEPSQSQGACDTAIRLLRDAEKRSQAAADMLTHSRREGDRLWARAVSTESLCNAALAAGLAAVEEERAQNERIAREHPYEECRKREAFEAFLLKLVETKGGCVVSSNDCSEWEIVAARACDRFYVDSRAYGYVIRPSARVAEREKTSEKQTAVVRHSLASTENAAVTSSPAEAPQEPGATPAPLARERRRHGSPGRAPRARQSEDAQAAFNRAVEAHGHPDYYHHGTGRAPASSPAPAAPDTVSLLSAAAERRPYEMVRRLCVSAASFIAEIDRSSSDVAEYLQQRLEEVLVAAYRNGAIGALERAVADARSLSRAPAAPEARGEALDYERVAEDAFELDHDARVAMLREVVRAERNRARDAALAPGLVLAEFAETAPGRLPERITEAIKSVRALRGKAESGEGGKSDGS